MFKFIFGVMLIGYGFYKTFVTDPVWGIYLFAALTHIRLTQLSESIYLPLQVPMAIASVTLILYVISKDYTTKFRRWPLEIWLFGFMVVAMAISSSQAAFDPGSSWKMTTDYLKYWVFFILFIQMIDSFDKIKNFHNVLILSAGWLVYRCWDLRGTTGARFENINGGSIGDSNHFAAALILLFPFVFQRIFDKNKLISIGSAILCFGIVMAVFITGSRGGLLGLAAVFFLLYLNFKQYRKKILMAIIVLGIAVTPFINEYHISRFKSLLASSHEETREASAESRVVFWKYSYELFKEHPIAGVGLRNFGYYSGHNIEGKPLGQRGHVAHSLWFQILAEGGLLLLVPFIYLLIRFFRKTKKLITSYFLLGKIEHAQHVIAVRVGLGAFLVNATFLNRLVYEPIYWCIALGVVHEFVMKDLLKEKPTKVQD